MVVDERARHELFTRLEESLGRAAADTMMGLLPPVGWADVARRQDVEALATATRRDLEQLEGRLSDRFEARLERALRRQLRGFVAFQFALAGALIAAAQLL